MSVEDIYLSNKSSKKVGIHDNTLHNADRLTKLLILIVIFLDQQYPTSIFV